MIHRHRIDDEDFDSLSTGHGGVRAVKSLRDSQLSKRLLLIRYIAQSWPGPCSERDSGVAALAEAQARDPEMMTEILTDPMVGAWTARTARRIRGSLASTEPLATDLGHLGALAATAASRCGSDADVVGYPREGWLALPTLGCAVVGDEDRPVMLRVRSGRISIKNGKGLVTVPEPAAVEAPPWRGVRRLTVGAQDRDLRVAVDDLDPYRHGYHIPAAQRLDEDEVRIWGDLFAQAWQLLGRYSADRALELAAGLRTVVPLVDDQSGPARSATVRDTFGAFGMTRPVSAPELAVTMVHEFQHSKLSAILDLVPLYHPDGSGSYFAPWRPDPRPIGGLFQGVYAFLGVADLWRWLREDPQLCAVAEGQFASVREQVHAGLVTLTDSRQLTAQGQRFAVGMRRTLDEMFTVEMPESAVATARDALRSNRIAWQVRNGRAA